MDECTRDSIDLCYIIKIDALFMYADACISAEEFELAKATNEFNYIVQEQYESFRLKEFASEYKCFIRDKVNHDILGYNPARNLQ